MPDELLSLNRDFCHFTFTVITDQFYGTYLGANSGAYAEVLDYSDRKGQGKGRKHLS